MAFIRNSREIIKVWIVFENRDMNRNPNGRSLWVIKSPIALSSATRMERGFERERKLRGPFKRADRSFPRADERERERERGIWNGKNLAGRVVD